ncbi:MAG: hypothetical protein IKO78_03760 [Bacilli bacterium]|nr:hypothetical protein [Bacilli bacterium]
MAVTPELERQKEDLYQETLANVKGTLNGKIIKNPMFEELFHKEFNYFLYKTAAVNFDVIIADDKNSVSISSYSPVVDCKPEFIGKNKSFLRTIFKLDEDDNLICDFNQGTLCNREDIEKDGTKVELHYESKLETNYSYRVFDKDGIQISDNSFSDVYPFNDEYSEVDLRERIMSSFHKPEFVIKGFPKIPIHVIRATVRNTYRKYDTLGIIHSNMGIATRDGYKELLCGLYTCHPDRPEMLRGFNRFAEAKGNSNNELRFKVVDDYATDINEAYEKATNEFKEAFDIMDSSSINKKTYNAIKAKLG